jgi:hypothetical protein
MRNLLSILLLIGITNYAEPEKNETEATVINLKKFKLDFFYFFQLEVHRSK